MHLPPEPPKDGMSVTLGSQEPRPIYTNYVFVQVMYNNRGAVKYDWFTNRFMLYLKLEEADFNRCPSLISVNADEVWIYLRTREHETVN